MTSFFVPCGNVHGSGCRFGVRFFLYPAVPILLYFVCVRGARWFYYLSQWWAEPSRASDELNDFLILTNERPTRFYYLFRGWTSRTIFLYWPTKAILIFFEEPRGIPSRPTGLTFRAVRRRSRIRRGRERQRGRFWGLRPEPWTSFPLLAICYKFNELVRLKIRVPDILEQDSK